MNTGNMKARHILRAGLAACLAGASAASRTIETPGPCSRRTGLTISEIMYHPADRADKRNLEFIEIYNSDPVDLEIGAVQTVKIFNHMAEFQRLTPAAGTFRIGWTTEAGSVYRLERTADLINPLCPPACSRTDNRLS